MRREFVKMQGLGNDFVLFDALSRPLALAPGCVRRLARRRFGIGCDQVLLIEPPRSRASDVYYRIYNADGGEVQQCGNGVRCVARYLLDRGLFAGPEIRVETLGGTVRVRGLDDGRVRVDMGVPGLEPAALPFEAPARARHYTLEVGGASVELAAVSMGNPHAVLQVDDVDSAPVEHLGPLVGRHPRFPEGVNVGFLQVCGRGRARLRVFERGVGETLACGTGACAAVVAGRLQDRFDEAVEVHLPGGALEVSWAGEDRPVFMTGPAETVFEGTVEL